MSRPLISTCRFFGRYNLEEEEQIRDNIPGTNQNNNPQGGKRGRELTKSSINPTSLSGRKKGHPTRKRCGRKRSDCDDGASAAPKFELNKMRDSSLALIMILQIPTAASEAAARRHARAVAMLAVEATCEYMYTYIILWP